VECSDELARGVFVYLLIWWMALFIVLPIGTRPVDAAAEDGGWRGAPERPLILRKVVGTTILAAFLWPACSSWSKVAGSISGMAGGPTPVQEAPWCFRAALHKIKAAIPPPRGCRLSLTGNSVLEARFLASDGGVCCCAALGAGANLGFQREVDPPSAV
jgi:predicted secreted protein